MFNVCVFHQDGSHDYVCRSATAEDAVRMYNRCTAPVFMALCEVIRVVITDDDGNIDAECIVNQGEIA